MNPWDVVTWLASAALGGSGILIFAFFLRESREILNRDLHHGDQEEGSASDEPGEWGADR